MSLLLKYYHTKPKKQEKNPILQQSATQSPNLPYAKAQSGLTQSYYTSLPFAPLASLDFLSPISVGRAGAITA